MWTVEIWLDKKCKNYTPREFVLTPIGCTNPWIHLSLENDFCHVEQYINRWIKTVFVFDNKSAETYCFRLYYITFTRLVVLNFKMFQPL
jgi:hypothetical protein